MDCITICCICRHHTATLHFILEKNVAAELFDRWNRSIVHNDMVIQFGIGSILLIELLLSRIKFIECQCTTAVPPHTS